MRRIIVFASLLALVNSSLPMTGAAPPSSMVSAALAPAMGHSLPFRSLPIATHDSPDSATFDATTPCNTPLVSQSSRPPGPASLPIGDFGSTASTTSLKPTAVYSYTGSPVITPTIDGPFTGLFVDGDGTLSPGPGLQNPLSFVVEKQFDADDNVYWHDPTVGLTAFTTWNPATMSLWRDGNDDGIFQTGLDAVIAGVVPISGTHGLELNGLALFPSGSSPLGMSPFVYNDAEFIYDTPPKANNRYDDGEDIFYVGQY